MKRIIVPTDFSETATNSLVYAHAIRTQLEGYIQLVHVYKPEAVYIDNNVFIDERIEQVRRERLDDYVNKINNSWPTADDDFVPIEGTFKIGFVIDEIRDLCLEENGNCLLVFGSNGESDGLITIFGSVSSKLIEITPCPALVIPPTVLYNKISNILCGVAELKKNTKALDSLVDFSRRFKAKLNFVHVNDDGVSYPQEEFINFIEANYKDLDYSFKILENDDISSAILAYAESLSIDVIAIVRKSRNFFERMFHKSISKELAKLANTPLLILPD
jgi:nucleotide-binding universal stress UspA family protein